MATSDKKIPTLSDTDAFYWSERGVLEKMSDEDIAKAAKRFEISSKALADHQAKASVKTEADFARKIDNMSPAEFDKEKANLFWEHERKRGQS